MYRNTSKAGDYLSWQDKAAELRLDKGVSWGELPEMLYKLYGKKFTFDQVRNTVRKHPRYKPDKKPIPLAIDKISKEVSKQALCDSHNLTMRVLQATLDDWRDEGYQILETDDTVKLCRNIVPQDNAYKDDWQGESIIRFGVVSDTHLCSKWQQLTFLNRLYDLFGREGISKVYHAGDITEGFKMRQGHEHEIFKFGADDQAQYVIDNYPYRPDITTEFITGNHDASHIKNGGIDIGRIIARERQDMIYLGQSNAKINLTPKCVLEINHPLDGASYAISYSLQKLIDSMSGGDKPNILINGHHHKAMYIYYRNIHAFEAGAIQAQTPWMHGKRLAAYIGGWIIEAHIDKDGTVTRCKGEFIPLYKPIQNDY